MTKLEELDNAISDIYQRAHRDHPNARLDPEVGVLGELWDVFDAEIAK